MPLWPALDVWGADPELLLAAVDEFSPVAGEEREAGLRVFFASPAARNAARDALAHGGVAADVVDVDDEDWARRSQEGLEAVSLGRITIIPDEERHFSRVRAAESESISLVIRPSMGFGTGHHATTRLCLAALQTLDLSGASVLDIGTGSGILAIAAARLGAASAAGLDSDPDAVQSARDNLALNPEAHGVSFGVADFTTCALPCADVVTANLTGALLVRASAILSRAVAPSGALIVSGLLTSERAAVRAAFDQLVLLHDREEDGWAGLVMKKL